MEGYDVPLRISYQNHEQNNRYLTSPDGSSLPNLRQHKTLLAEKLEVLSKLDNELIEMVDEEELDDELEQADVIKGRIGLCTMDINQALAQAEGHSGY